MSTLTRLKRALLTKALSFEQGGLVDLAEHGYSYSGGRTGRITAGTLRRNARLMAAADELVKEGIIECDQRRCSWFVVVAPDEAVNTYGAVTP